MGQRSPGQRSPLWKRRRRGQEKPLCAGAGADAAGRRQKRVAQLLCLFIDGSELRGLENALVTKERSFC